MQARQEKIEYENPLLSIKVWQAIRNADILYTWHHHPECELLLVQQGRLDVEVNGETHIMGEGDVVVLGSSQLHRDRSYDDSQVQYLVLQFDLQAFFDQSTISYLQYFNETKVPLSAMNYLFKENEAARREAAACIAEIYEEARRKEAGYELAVNLLIKKILLTLIRHDKMGLLAGQDRVERMRLKPVLDYVEAGITGRVTVEDACRLANMSYYYFVKFFKKSMGISFTEYVNFRKIKTAEQLLLTRDLSVSEVGDRIGMPNMAHFYKMFKRFNHCSPKEFQRKMLAWGR
ncbi:AraC family transcriptional regulator [Cohnella sp. 56]|uniref:AraC family transcriptional regulator n=1 Tax=Cohnella sp. 56 TaxID=3113722 RepID=UPI0030E92361